MEFNSDVPILKCKQILVYNFTDEVWNFPTVDYTSHNPETFVGVWKIKQLKK